MPTDVNSGPKSWSSVTLGKKERSGGFHNQQSPFFQEEFPTLAGGDKSPQSKDEEESKEAQYGPGPSLRPQSKCT